MPWLSSRPPGAQQVGEAAGVEVDPLPADVLDHADAGDRVEAGLGQLAVVGDADLDPVGDAGCRGPLPRQPGLRLGEGDPEHADAVARGGVDREAAPAAADVEHPLALAQTELRADQLELCLLRLLERRGAAGEDRAAVGHRLVEEEGEELVGDVVVVADRAQRRAPACGARPRGTQLRRGPARGPGQAAGAHRRERQPPPRLGVERRRLPASSRPITASRSSGSSVAGDVGAADPELAGRPQRVGDRPRRADPEGRPVVGGGDPGPVPELDRERALREAALDLLSQRRRVGEGHRREASQNRDSCGRCCYVAAGPETWTGIEPRQRPRTERRLETVNFRPLRGGELRDRTGRSRSSDIQPVQNETADRIITGLITLIPFLMLVRRRLADVELGAAAQRPDRLRDSLRDHRARGDRRLSPPLHPPQLRHQRLAAGRLRRPRLGRDRGPADLLGRRPPQAPRLLGSRGRSAQPPSRPRQRPARGAEGLLPRPHGLALHPHRARQQGPLRPRPAARSGQQLHRPHLLPLGGGRLPRRLRARLGESAASCSAA